MDKAIGDPFQALLMTVLQVTKEVQLLIESCLPFEFCSVVVHAPSIIVLVHLRQPKTFLYLHNLIHPWLKVLIDLKLFFQFSTGKVASALAQVL